MKPISEAHNIDCKLYMKTLPDKCIDVAIVDPPYGINAPNMTMGSNMNRKHGRELRRFKSGQRCRYRVCK